MASTVTCGYADSNWELNSSGENACQVYAQLQGQCNSSFVIATAHSTDPPYTPPNNACGCNVVAYNLMGGCAWCQTGLLTGWWLPIDQWVGNCTQAMYDPTGIPSTISTGSINIPQWAFAIPSLTSWSPSQASRIAVPESSTSTSTFSFSFTTPRTSTTTTRFANGGDDDSSFNTVNLTNLAISGGATAGIAVGVILGLWALSTILVIIVYFSRQNKRKAWYGPLAAFYSGQKGYHAGGGGAYPPGPGPTAPLLFSPQGNEGYSPGHSPPVGGYQPPPTGPTGYIPPPPDQHQQAYQGYHVGGGGAPPGGAPAWGSPATHTTSMYGAPTTGYSGSQTALSSAPGHPTAAGAPVPGGAGYRGHAEVY